MDEEYEILNGEVHDEEDREGAYEKAALLSLKYSFQLLTTAMPSTGLYDRES